MVLKKKQKGDQEKHKHRGDQGQSQPPKDP